MHHREGGPDPTELLYLAQPVFHRPTGACHTSHIIPPGRFPGGSICASRWVGRADLCGHQKTRAVGQTGCLPSDARRGLDCSLWSRRRSILQSQSVGW